MKIGLISDTHIPSMGAEPPSQVVQAFEGVDLILHAGHVDIDSCIKWLERIAPVTATTSWLVGTGEALPRMNTVKVVEAENHTIGICHELILKSLSDDVIPPGRSEGRSLLESRCPTRYGASLASRSTLWSSATPMRLWWRLTKVCFSSTLEVPVW